MKNFNRTLFLSAIFLHLVGLVMLTWHWQTVSSQTRPLTYSEINTALNAKLPPQFKNKGQLIKWLIIQIKQRKVDKPLTPDREDLLHEAGATDELIEVIRENSPSLPMPTPTPTPIVREVIKEVPVYTTPSPAPTPNQGSSNSSTNSIGMEFVLIPSGSFMMGSPTSESNRYDNETQHQVTISNSFYLGKYEITQEQWEKVMGSNASYFKNCPRCPVEQVSWEDVQDFISKLNAKGEGRYRLPTEAEWEYAARAGSTTKYSYGEGESSLGNYAWFADNSGNHPHEVGTKQPNDWGLYDMQGNVWELCQDWYGNYPSGSVTDPTGATSSLFRGSRGGSWNNSAGYLRSAIRYYNSPSTRVINLGFRLIRE